MRFNFDTIHYLIYAAMLGYLLAFLAELGKSKNFAKVSYLLGFALAVVAFTYRWYDVEHVPLQSLFEVFLCLGMLIYPLSLFAQRFLGVRAGAADALIGVIILFPTAFVFKAEPQQLPPALQSWLFAPHVAAYMFAYVIMAKASVQAVAQLLSRAKAQAGDYELGTYRMVSMGFPLLSLGLILGSWWGKIAWGDYWNWDPKELWSLVSWLIYLGYFHFRYMFGKKRPNINAALALAGFLAIIITLLWANLSRLFAGLHNYG